MRACSSLPAFGLEAFYLLRKGQIGIAAAYVALSVLVGMLVLWIGFISSGKPI